MATRLHPPASSSHITGPKARLAVMPTEPSRELGGPCPPLEMLRRTLGRGWGGGLQAEPLLTRGLGKALAVPGDSLGLRALGTLTLPGSAGVAGIGVPAQARWPGQMHCQTPGDVNLGEVTEGSAAASSMCPG